VTAVAAGPACTLDSIGHAHDRLGHYAEAITLYELALRLEQAIGDRCNSASTFIRLGDVHRDAGDRAAARDAWRQALVILDEMHHPDGDEVRMKLRGLDSVSR
jgi:tetratricopeptide (TPR) repeat protein